MEDVSNPALKLNPNGRYFTFILRSISIIVIYGYCVNSRESFHSISGFKIALPCFKENEKYNTISRFSQATAHGTSTRKKPKDKANDTNM